MSVAFRQATPSDLDAVIRMFLDSTRADHTSGLVQMDDWLAVMMPQARKLFTRRGAEVLIAYETEPAEEGRDHIGWIAHERGHPWPYVVYVYVLHDFRRWGMARRLFDAAGIDPMGGFRHATWIPKPLAVKVPRARWEPLIVRFDRRKDEQRQERRRPGQGATQADKDRNGPLQRPGVRTERR